MGGAKGKTLDRYISATGSEIDARFSPQHTPCPSLASAPTRLWLAVTVWGSGPQNRNFTFGDIKRVTFKTFFFEFAYRRAARSSLASEIFEKILNYVFELGEFENFKKFQMPPKILRVDRQNTAMGTNVLPWDTHLTRQTPDPHLPPIKFESGLKFSL